MKPTDSDSEFSFETRGSDVVVTRKQRLNDFYREFIYRPGLVAWSDNRTRLGALLLLVYVLMGTVGVVYYRTPISNQSPRSVRPFQTMDALLGTTGSGVDILAMLIHATPPMLIMILSGGLFATTLAVTIGTVAGYKGGVIDRALTTFADIAMSIPGLPLVMVLAIVFSPENPAVIGILLTINYWAGLARAIRSQILTLREEAYVEASRTLGVSTWRILVKDIIPNIMPYVLVNFANAARFVVFSSVGLYYLGILPTSVANWGVQLDQAYQNAGALTGAGTLYQLVFPMLAIMFIALALILLAQGMDRVFNPRVRTRLAGESQSRNSDDPEPTPGTEVLN